MLKRFNINKIWDVFDIARPITREQPIHPIRTKKEEMYIDTLGYNDAGDYVLVKYDEYVALVEALDVAIKKCNELNDEVSDIGYEVMLLRNEYDTNN
jgi:hypothetical protein